MNRNAINRRPIADWNEQNHPPLLSLSQNIVFLHRGDFCASLDSIFYAESEILQSRSMGNLDFQARHMLFNAFES